MESIVAETSNDGVMIERDDVPKQVTATMEIVEIRN